MQPYGALDCFGRRSEGGAGGNVGKRVPSGHNRRRRLATRSSGKQQVGRTTVRTAPIVCPEESPLLASMGNNFPVSKSPRRGLTRRLRRELGLAVPWGAHTFLSVAKEKCAKESQRHGDSGKKASTAHFDGGARYVARSRVGQLTPAIVRARSSPFSAVKMGGPFSLRCLSPLCPGAVGVGHTYPLQGGMLRRELYIFATQKASVKSKSRWPFALQKYQAVSKHPNPQGVRMPHANCGGTERR